MSMFCTDVFAYDIAAENEDGVMIYYRYINNGKELEVLTEHDYLDTYWGGYENITHLRIPEEVTYMNRTRKVTSIATRTFSPYGYNKISLISISIPKTINHIGKAAFWNCNTLEKVIVEDIGAWCEIDFELDGGQNGGGGMLSNPLVYAGHLYSDENTEITDLTIPEGTTKISDYAFYGCTSITSLKISDEVKSIGNSAFYNSINLLKVDIGDGVQDVGGYAFYGCSSLNTISFGSGIKSIGEYAFRGENGWNSKHNKIIVKDINAWCNLSMEYEQYGTPLIGEWTYSSPDNYICLYSDDTHMITDLIIPEGVTAIKNWIFHGVAGIKSVVIPNSVTTLGISAFSYCPDLEKISIGNGITKLEDNVFANCNKLFDVKFGNNITKIEAHAFEYCGFTSLRLPDGIESIGEYAFYSCQNLSSLTIPKTVVKIEYNAFTCDNLATVVTLIEEPFSILTHSYINTYSAFSKNTLYNATLYVPVGTLAKYQNTEGWKDFIWIEEGLPSSITAIKKESNEQSRFTIDGRNISRPLRGINIIKMPNSTTKKVMIK